MVMISAGQLKIMHLDYYFCSFLKIEGFFTKTQRVLFIFPTYPQFLSVKIKGVTWIGGTDLPAGSALEQ